MRYDLVVIRPGSLCSDECSESSGKMNAIIAKEIRNFPEDLKLSLAGQRDTADS